MTPPRTDESDIPAWPERGREYRIVTNAGQVQSTGLGNRQEAIALRAWWDQEYPNFAPHALASRPVPSDWEYE